MKISKRKMRILVIGGLLLGVFILFAGVANAEKIELSFWYWGTHERKALIDELARRFSAKYPNIEVKPQLFPWAGFAEKVFTATAAGMAPDAHFISTGQAVTWGTKGVALDLAPYLKKTGLWDDIWPGRRHMGYYQGKQYSVPLSATISAFWYNKKTFEEVGLNPMKGPETWDEVMEYAKKLVKYDEKGKIIRSGFYYTHDELSINHFPSILWTFGSDLFDPETKEVLFNNPGGVEMLQWYYDLEREYKVYAPVEKLQYWEAMMQGYGAMLSYGIWTIRFYVRENFKDYAVAASPAHKGKRVVQIEGMEMGCNARSKHPEEACDWVAYLMSPEAQVYFQSVNFTIPGTRSAFESEGFQELLKKWDPKVKDILWQDLPAARALTTHPATVEVWDLWVEAWQNSVRTGRMSPKEALDLEAKRATEALAEKY